MAKKLTVDKQQNDNSNSFNKLNDLLSKISEDGGILEDNVYSKIDEWIPTGSYILNAALSGSLFGGMPNRRSLCFYGESGSGKSFLSLSICRKAQEMGYTPIYCDTEASIDKEFVSKLGVNPKKFRIEPINTIEELSHYAASLLKIYDDAKAKGETMPKVIFVIDSLGNLSSSKEVSDVTEGSDKRDMTKQQNIRKFFRVNGLKFAKHGIPLIVVTHSYSIIGSYFPSNEASGGGGLKYNVSMMFDLSKSKLDDKEGEQIAKNKNVEATRVGITVTVKPVKQRFAKPIKVKIHIPFYKKPNPFVGLEPFVSWDVCGIMRGKLITEKEYSKMSANEQKICKEFIIDENGKSKTMYAYPKETARTLVCKHLNGEVPINELFTEKVFTQEILQELDNKIIKPTFSLPDVNSLDELAEITEDITDDIVEDLNIPEED